MGKEEAGRITIERACSACGEHYAPGTTVCPKDGTELSSIAQDNRQSDAASWQSASGGSTGEEEDGQSEMSRTHAQQMLGQVLNEQYELISIIGFGGMSVVYKAKDRKLDKLVAVKMLLPHLMLQTQSMQRFKQEAHSASSLDHPNIVSVYNFGEAPNGQPFLVMDLLRGRSLTSLIKRDKRVKPDRALNIFIQIASALAHAHQKGIIHRDLKPSNIILLEKDGQSDIVKIVDFGIAKLLPHEGRDAVNLTQTGDVFGSPLYMSPEQCKGEKLDSRADIYSMGCLMYECIAGVTPHGGDNMLEVLYRHLNEVPRSFKQLKLGAPVPNRLEAIIFKALAKDPAQRHQSMQALLDELSAFQDARNTSVVRRLLTRLEIMRLRQRPRNRSEKVWLAVSISSLMLLAACAAYFSSLYAGADESPVFKQEVKFVEPAPPLPVDIGYWAVTAYDAAINRADNYLAGDRSLHFSDLIQGLQNIAQTMHQKGHWDKAAICYEKAAQISAQSNGPKTVPTLELHWRLAGALFNIGDYARAEAEYLTLKPSISDYVTDQLAFVRTYFISVAEAQYFQKKYATAAESYRAFFRSCKGLGLAWMRFTPRTLERYVEQANRLATTEKYAVLLSHFAETLIQLEKYGEAETVLEEAARRWHSLARPENEAVAYFKLARCQAVQNKDANNAYRSAVSTLKEMTGKNEPLIAIVEKDYSDWLWKRADFLRAIAAKFDYSRIVARIKANESTGFRGQH